MLSGRGGDFQSLRWHRMDILILPNKERKTNNRASARLNVTFIDKDDQKHHFKVAKGDNLLDIAQANDLEMEGACGGSCACSTCHVIVEDPDMYDKLEEPDDDENDMLDLAFGLTETSRLGCQVKMSPELDGLVYWISDIRDKPSPLNVTKDWNRSWWIFFLVSYD
ncbi:hypothetical protein HCAG_00572 [Histoplasma mississippiense (nom. inval.)]|uniref:hypothetical protein n=1 Tax=Ajellomyces capsulatus (strain NAm1 / WU24) TaxID=2059318 RepID=UPI000157B35E|nr:hypothetical protein HCAG_00572 [Histoplasma mississippiense (nom. inval.)]EDN02708.1 hypothetical protein HCAG_00572 [Histoplasma mississippiense (nom. inval.)]